MPKEKPDLIYGTLDMLILRSLQPEPRHSLAIADRCSLGRRRMIALRAE